jgi:WD40 repeat protein
VLAVAFSRDGRTTRLWNVTDPAKPTELTILTGHTDVVRSAVFTPDGRTLVTGSGDRTVRLEDLSHLALTSHTESVYAVVFSPMADLAATTSGDKPCGSGTSPTQTDPPTRHPSP